MSLRNINRKAGTSKCESISLKKYQYNWKNIRKLMGRGPMFKFHRGSMYLVKIIFSQHLQQQNDVAPLIKFIYLAFCVNHFEEFASF